MGSTRVYLNNKLFNNKNYNQTNLTKSMADEIIYERGLLGNVPQN